MVSTSQITVNYFDPTVTPACDTSGNPIFQTQTVTVVKGVEDSQTLIFNEIANIQGMSFCSPGVAAIPDGWQIRPEHQRPQAIFQFAKVDANGNIIGPPNNPITVPHFLNNQPTTGLPNYVKGNWEIIYVLDDNSKITIHSKDETNGMLVLNAILPLLDPKYTTKPYLSKSSLVVTTTPIAQNTVKCRMVKYYSTGALNNVPDWIVKF